MLANLNSKKIQDFIFKTKLDKKIQLELKLEQEAKRLGLGVSEILRTNII